MNRCITFVCLALLAGCSEDKKPAEAGGGSGGVGGAADGAGAGGIADNPMVDDPPPGDDAAAAGGGAGGNGGTGEGGTAGMDVSTAGGGGGGTAGQAGLATDDNLPEFDAGVGGSIPRNTGDGGANRLCNGLDEVSSATTNRCYRIVVEPASWAAAVADCTLWSKAVGHLAAITSADEDAFLTPLTGQSAWIGATDAPSEGQFQWVSGETWFYQNFADGQPSNLNGLEHCVEKLPGGQWNDVACGELRAYICERQLTLIGPNDEDQLATE